jgi:type VI secretion system secreted protein Hcp
VAFDAFLKLTTATGQPVQGESTDKVHVNEIPITGYSVASMHPVNQGSATGGAGAGKATFNDFSFTAPTSKVTPLLFQACAQGTRYNTAVVSVRKTGTGAPVDYLQITMGTVFVSQLSTGAAAGEATSTGPAVPVLPHDEVHLSYGSIKFSYTPHNASGGVSGPPVNGGWDVQKNTPTP